nr:hypothetical protein [Tanacetum cinerariifolium]
SSHPDCHHAPGWPPQPANRTGRVPARPGLRRALVHGPQLRRQNRSARHPILPLPAGPRSQPTQPGHRVSSAPAPQGHGAAPALRPKQRVLPARPRAGRRCARHSRGVSL